VYGTPRFAEMRDKCIGQELSWERPAVKWEAVLEELFFGAEGAAAPQQPSRPSPAEAKASVTTPVQVLLNYIVIRRSLSRLLDLQSVYKLGGVSKPLQRVQYDRLGQPGRSAGKPEKTHPHARDHWRDVISQRNYS